MNSRQLTKAIREKFKYHQFDKAVDFLVDHRAILNPIHLSCSLKFCDKVGRLLKSRRWQQCWQECFDNPQAVSDPFYLRSLVSLMIGFKKNKGKDAIRYADDLYARVIAQENSLVRLVDAGQLSLFIVPAYSLGCVQRAASGLLLLPMKVLANRIGKITRSGKRINQADRVYFVLAKLLDNTRGMTSLPVFAQLFQCILDDLEDTSINQLWVTAGRLLSASNMNTDLLHLQRYYDRLIRMIKDQAHLLLDGTLVQVWSLTSRLLQYANRQGQDQYKLMIETIEVLLGELTDRLQDRRECLNRFKVADMFFDCQQFFECLQDSPVFEQFYRTILRKIDNETLMTDERLLQGVIGSFRHYQPHARSGDYREMTNKIFKVLDHKLMKGRQATMDHLINYLGFLTMIYPKRSDAVLVKPMVTCIHKKVSTCVTNGGELSYQQCLQYEWYLALQAAKVDDIDNILLTKIFNCTEKFSTKERTQVKQLVLAGRMPDSDLLAYNESEQTYASRTQIRFSMVIESLLIPSKYKIEKNVWRNGLEIDLLITMQRDDSPACFAVNIDGPYHFYHNSNKLNATTRFRNRLQHAHNMVPISINCRLYEGMPRDQWKLKLADYLSQKGLKTKVQPLHTQGMSSANGIFKKRCLPGSDSKEAKENVTAKRARRDNRVNRAN